MTMPSIISKLYHVMTIEPGTVRWVEATPAPFTCLAEALEFANSLPSELAATIIEEAVPPMEEKH
jgi:hypothetical protein